MDVAVLTGGALSESSTLNGPDSSLQHFFRKGGRKVVTESIEVTMTLSKYLSLSGERKKEFEFAGVTSFWQKVGGEKESIFKSKLLALCTARGKDAQP
jgi:hypothetical protein